jgi:hypothetical protein
MMLQELEVVLAAVPAGSTVAQYRSAILDKNVLGKTTDSTRLKTQRHLRELYALDEQIPIFSVLRSLNELSSGTSLPMLALLVAWARDPLLRATTVPVLDALPGSVVDTASLAQSIEEAFPSQYTAISCHRVARNAASTWSQSGHLTGRTKKSRTQVKATVTAVTMALFLGDVAGYRGVSAFSNPWCALLDLSADRARAMGLEAHRAGLLNLRALGDVVELSFPMLDKVRGISA